MNYTLILLKDGRNILVSDEEINNKDYYYNSLDNAIRKGNSINHPYHSKIIAGIESLPTLTYSNEVKQILRDKYGWVDWVELAITQEENEINKNSEYNSQSFFNGVEFGFKANQSITNKMFSLEEIKEAFGNRQAVSFLQLEQSLQQPIQLNVEVETETKYYMFNGNEVLWASQRIKNPLKGVLGDCEFPNEKEKCASIIKQQPKITNNSIKIIKICK